QHLSPNSRIRVTSGTTSQYLRHLHERPGIREFLIIAAVGLCARRNAPTYSFSLNEPTSGRRIMLDVRRVSISPEIQKGSERLHLQRLADVHAIRQLAEAYPILVDSHDLD